MKKTAKYIARAGIVGALYVAMTFIVMPIAYTPIQFRISEALTILPLIFPETAIGLTIGCLIANIFGNGYLDLVFGTTATLCASIITAFVGKHVHKTVPRFILGALPPIVLNAVIVPVTFMTASDTAQVYFLNALSVGFGQLVVIAVLGPLVYLAATKINARLNPNSVEKQETLENKD